MNFTFPSCVGGLAAALQTYSTETNAANAVSPTIDDVCDILRRSFPRSYLVWYKKAEKLNNISTAVQSQNLQARVHTTAFNDADTVFITDIYSAGENELDDINKESLISALIAGGHKDARGFENLEKLHIFLEDNLEEGDVIIF